MPFRIRDILLVSSLYDLYVFEEDGRLYELIREEYKGLNLSHSPEITRVSRGKEAIKLAKQKHRYDLIITTQHIEDMSALQLARRIKNAGLDIPVVLLTYDARELMELEANYDTSVFEEKFIWTGDFRLIIAIIKVLEDRRNVDHDAKMVGVQSIILIEDDVRFYSAFLPMLYTEIFKQSQRLIIEGVNLSDKYLRMRARPKILLATSYEQAWKYFKRYEDLVLGIISDIDFWRKGKHDPQAGIKLTRKVKERHSDIPVLLQSTRAENEPLAHAAGASFLLKNSSTLLTQLRNFAIEKFGFGDFVFRLPDGTEAGRATNLRELERLLKTVPDESIKYHAEHNHFSNWLKARTEFTLAVKLRPRKVSDYPSIQALRDDLVNSLRDYRKSRQKGIITDFKKESYNPQSDLARIGSGSLGGKARGLSFLNALINNFNFQDKFKDVDIKVPPGIIIGTDVFDFFLDQNDLRSFALNANDDEELTKAFLAAESFPADIIWNLRDFLELVDTPLAVRSSSLLEDSQYHPFAGIYETYMIPNHHPDLEVRLRHLLTAIKRVYASTFFQATKEYIRLTSYRLEEEKMGVVIQKLVGSRHGDRFYPTFSGVAKSYNFYPVPPQTSDDGIASVALGLGKFVVDGGTTVKFSPKYPQHLLQFSSPKEALKNSQHKFYALDFREHPDGHCETRDVCVKLFPLKAAEEDGCLYHLGSTYSHENESIYDGLSRPGVRIVTFAPILKHKVFPLPDILTELLKICKWGMGNPVEIEFAVNLNVPRGEPKEFGVVQVRPLVLAREMEALDLKVSDPARILCESPSVLGHGVIKDVRDIVFVDIHKFSRAHTRDVAREVSQLNAKLHAANRPYLLIGLGRWGSMDPWLGIPVKWDQISGAKTIVETSFKDFMVQPSQGSHFFHNLTSFRVGYFTVNPFKNQGFIDWEWLLGQPAAAQLTFTRHVALDKPLVIQMNGKTNKGIILKPGD
ncbi:MAG TPA: response regulator [Caldithrix abyssi]|uniref:Response regulator n=1 Tax=Caldithrix abyssi TaxID=187145 RepID=A0A7V5PQ27_CALAY|nr:response regulator [Caldithrix abyssi]